MQEAQQICERSIGEGGDCWDYSPFYGFVFVWVSIVCMVEPQF